MPKSSKAKPAPEPAAPSEDAATLHFQPMVSMVHLTHDEIIPSTSNPRKDIDESELTLLAESISERGLLQNIVVAEPMGLASPPYEIVAGERRWRAIGQLIEAGRWSPDVRIPCGLIASPAVQSRLAVALMENLVRSDLKPLEEAKAFSTLRDEFGLPTEEIALRIHRTQRFVQQRLQLLTLSATEQRRLEDGAMSVEEARKRIANRPTPITLSEDATLLAAEILHKIDAEPMEGAPHRTEVAHATEAEPDSPLAELIQRGLTYGPRAIYGEDHFDTGRRAISMHRFDTPPLPEVCSPYRAAWLNGPFEVPEAFLEEVENARAERRAADDLYATEQAEAADRRSMLWTRLETVRAKPPARATAVGKEVAEMCEGSDYPLPWCVALDGGSWPRIIDAKGKTVLILGHEDEIKVRLIVMAANSAAGFATPDSPEPAILDEPDQDELPEADEGPTTDVADPDLTEPLLAAGDPPADEDAEVPASMQRLAGVPEAALA